MSIAASLAAVKSWLTMVMIVFDHECVCVCRMMSVDTRASADSTQRISLLQEALSVKEKILRDAKDELYRKEVAMGDLEEQLKRAAGMSARCSSYVFLRLWHSSTLMNHFVSCARQKLCGFAFVMCFCDYLPPNSPHCFILRFVLFVSHGRCLCSPRAQSPTSTDGAGASTATAKG